MSAIEILEEKLQQADETFKVSFSRENYVEKEDEGWKILHILPESWDEPFYKTNLQVVSTLGIVSPEGQPFVFPLVFKSNDDDGKFSEARVYSLEEEVIHTSEPNPRDFVRNANVAYLMPYPTISNLGIEQIGEGKYKVSGTKDIGVGIFSWDIEDFEFEFEI